MCDPEGCATILGAVGGGGGCPPPPLLTQTQHLFVGHLRTRKQTKLTRRTVTGHSSCCSTSKIVLNPHPKGSHRSVGVRIPNSRGHTKSVIVGCVPAAKALIARRPFQWKTSGECLAIRRRPSSLALTTRIVSERGQIAFCKCW